MKRDRALKILAEHAEALRREFALAHLDIFGSVARDAAGSTSDIDILVEYPPNAQPDLFRFIALQQRLETLLGVKVDLVTERALKKQLKEQIMREKVRAA